MKPAPLLKAQGNGRVKQSLRLFFDQCCSKRLARVISEAFSNDNFHVETRHLSEFCRPNTGDEEWLPLLKKREGWKGDWIVITADRGKDPKKRKLPLICSKEQITFVALTSSPAKAGYKAQEKALRLVFPEPMHVHLLPKGMKVSLGCKTTKGNAAKIGALSIQQTSLARWCAKNGMAWPTELNPN